MFSGNNFAVVFNPQPLCPCEDGHQLLNYATPFKEAKGTQMNVVVPWSWMSTEIPRPEFSREGTDETHTTAELEQWLEEAWLTAISPINTWQGCSEI